MTQGIQRHDKDAFVDSFFLSPFTAFLSLFMPVFASKLPSVSPYKEGIVQTLFRQKDSNDNLDLPCYIDAVTNKSLTFKQVRDMSLEFGAGLQDVFGFQKDDVLAIYAPNTVWLI